MWRRGERASDVALFRAAISRGQKNHGPNLCLLLLGHHKRSRFGGWSSVSPVMAAFQHSLERTVRFGSIGAPKFGIRKADGRDRQKWVNRTRTATDAIDLDKSIAGNMLALLSTYAIMTESLRTKNGEHFQDI
jgi:hypothetical protein